MKRFFDNELETFRSHLILMGEIAMRQVREATKALVEGDPALAKRVIEADDELDELEKRIDEEAIRYMNLRSPVATELRLIIVGMKVAHDLERVGDETTNIARRVSRLAAEQPIKINADVPRMSAIAIEMLRDALECFLQDDERKAIQVCQRDNEVDELNRKVYREFAEGIAKDPSTLNRALETMFIAKSLERVADHASNIAEEMIYLAKGRDIRHTPEVKNAPPL